MNNLELKQICLWPLSAKLIVITVLFFLICSLGYILDIKYLKAQLITIKQQNLSLKQKLQQHNDNNDKDKPANFEKIQKIYKQQLQQQIIIPAIVNDVANVAHKNHVKLKSLQPKDSAIEDWLILHPIEITANGNYHQLITFINQLINLPYFIVVQNFKLTRKKNTHQNLTLQASIIIYNKEK